MGLLYNIGVFNRKDEHLTIRKRHYFSEEETDDHIPYVAYDIYFGKKVVGDIQLSLIMNDYMYYYGHIGYHIIKWYRGHHFARSACILLMQEALREHGMEEFVITCDPDNIASIKTIEGLPRYRFISKVNVPEDHPLYLKGERVKLIYKVSL